MKNKVKKSISAVFLLSFLILCLFVVPGYSFQNEVELSSISFFEGGYEVPDASNRQFTDDFQKSETRYIWCLLTVKNLLYNVKQQTHDIVWKYYDAQGKLVGEITNQMAISSAWEFAELPGGWGWDSPGNWTGGTYTAKIFVDGQLIGEKNFTVVNDNPKMEFEYIKLFEGGDPAPEESLRSYTTSFSGKEARFIYYMVGAKNLLYQVERQRPLIYGRYYGPDGSFIGEADAIIDIPSDWSNADIWSGWGWPDPGNWNPGDYRVDIFFGDQKVAEKTFTVSGEMQMSSHAPDDVKGIMDQGVGFIDSGDYQSAIREFTRVISIDPSYGDAYYNRAIAYSSLEDYDNAIKDYTKAIEMNPQDYEAYNYRAAIYETKGETQKAIDGYTKAVEINPNYDSAFNNRGVLYFRMGQYDKAMEDYNSAIKINPLQRDAYYNRGLVYYNQGENDKAIKDYTRSIEINPRDSQAYINRGLVYYNQGDYKTAVKNYTQAITINPMYGDAYYNRGLAYDNLGDFDRAIADYTKAIEINPNDTDAYYNRGLAYDKKGQQEKAISDYTKASSEEEIREKEPVSRLGKKREKIYKTAIVEFTERGDLQVKDAGDIVAEWMTSSMIKTGVFEIYTRLSIQDILKEQEFQSTTFIDVETAAKAGKIRGVEAIVTGSVIKFGNIVSVAVKLIDTETARIIDSADIKVKSIDELPDHLDRLAEELAME
ncbi:MAG: tetratricopeptide repeat protein [Candidatus Aureabacteria bacterium]|nr:tetratricopeptide repeat protein [Candidatus Auribacterota bacterium]